MSPPIKLVVSVDTEEDNWHPATRGITTRNIDQLPSLGAFFRGLGIRPTYFVTYRVAVSPAAAVVRAMAGDEDVEIGAHLHPWNTPPSTGLEEDVSMLGHYPASSQLHKMQVLLRAIRKSIGVRPESFRAGRFGLGRDTITALRRCGVKVDSSVTPHLSWAECDGGPDFRTAPSDTYRIGMSGDPCVPAPDGPVIEVPISVGYTRFHPRRWSGFTRLLGTPLATSLHLGGLAARGGLMRRVILSPETNSVEEMLRLSRRLIEGGTTHLHMFFHSNSLIPGQTPFARTPADVEELYRRVDGFVTSLDRLGDRTSFTVSEAAASCAPSRRSAPSFAPAVLADHAGAIPTSTERLLA